MYQTLRQMQGSLENNSRNRFNGEYSSYNQSNTPGLVFPCPRCIFPRKKGNGFICNCILVTCRNGALVLLLYGFRLLLNHGAMFLELGCYIEEKYTEALLAGVLPLGSGARGLDTLSKQLIPSLAEVDSRFLALSVHVSSLTRAVFSLE